MPPGGCRRNEVRDLMANLFTDVCHDINVEPRLQPLWRNIHHP